jgi:response regulator NasT
VVESSNRRLRIAVADDDPTVCRFYQDALGRLGHEVTAVADGRQLVDQCRASRPDLVITDIKIPEVDGLAAAAEIAQVGPVPVILVSAYHEPELVRRAGQEYIFAYLVKPITEANLVPAIGLTLQRFERYRALHKEAADLRQALEDRKLVERAKGVIMRRVGVDEPDAYRRLRRLASDRNRRLAEVAQLILDAEDVFRPLEEEASQVVRRPGHGPRGRHPTRPAGAHPPPPPCWRRPPGSGQPARPLSESFPATVPTSRWRSRGRPGYNRLYLRRAPGLPHRERAP